MRILAQPRVRIRHPHLFEKVSRAGACLSTVQPLMSAKTFSELPANGENRVEGCHWLLEDHRHVATANASHPPRVRADEIERAAIAAPQDHLPMIDMSALPGQKTHHREGSGGLAGARFPDDADTFPGLDGEIEVFHGRDAAETDAQARNPDDGLIRHRLRPPGRLTAAGR